jgi:hypothetical protein
VHRSDAEAGAMLPIRKKKLIYFPHIIRTRLYPHKGGDLGKLVACVLVVWPQYAKDQLNICSSEYVGEVVETH